MVTSKLHSHAALSDGVVFHVHGVTKVYQMGEVQVHALRGVDLDLYRGEFTVLLGASGSGKSTLLNILGGLDTPTDGHVLYGDRDLTRASESELTQYRRYHVGFVFQFYNLIPSLTALENVAVVTEIARSPMQPQEALATGRPGRTPGSLSGAAFRRRTAAGGDCARDCEKARRVAVRRADRRARFENRYCRARSPATGQPGARYQHRGDYPQRGHRANGGPGDSSRRRAYRRSDRQRYQARSRSTELVTSPR